MLKYKSLPYLYKFVSTLLKIAPIPSWITIRTKYGLMLVPKTFRVITMIFDLVEPEVKGWFEDAVKNANFFIDIGAAYGYYTLKAAKINEKFPFFHLSLIAVLTRFFRRI